MSSNKITPVILSGGSGTRLWPMSTPETPKQFLHLVGEKTMFELTVERTAASSAFDAPIIVGSANHLQLTQQQLKSSGVEASSIILEPMARNTAPAIAIAALAAGADETQILVMPSDHIIGDPASFLAAVNSASPAASEGHLVTFGITPTGPETGYGYIKMGAEIADIANVHKAEKFIEKPALEKAEEMLKAGNHAWNAGIFLFRADRYLAELKIHAPEMHAAAIQSFENAKIEGRLVFPEESAFAACPSDSIDYAVMENADRVGIVPVDCAWSDVGSWDALHEIGAENSDNMVLHGDVTTIDSSGCLIQSDGVKIAAAGVKDLIIVANGKSVLILPRGQSQKVKNLVEKMKDA